MKDQTGGDCEKWIIVDSLSGLSTRILVCFIQQIEIPADLSHTGRAYWKVAAIDRCIAPIVEALQLRGIDIRGSCCGHGKMDGDIHLQDGRILIIKQDGNKYLKERR